MSNTKFEMLPVFLPEQTIGKLRQMAARKGTDISELLDRAIERYLADEPRFATPVPNAPTGKQIISDQIGAGEQDEQIVKIEREQEAFEAQHTRLLVKYSGQYIAMRHAKVVDHDLDSSALWQRVHKRFGSEPILITPVLNETRQTISLRSPRLLENMV